LLSLEGSQAIDTSGVVWLTHTHNAFREAGGTLVLYAVPPTILDLLHFLRVTPLLHLADDERAALELAHELTTHRDTKEEPPPLRIHAV
jgi:hypothetical protein